MLGAGATVPRVLVLAIGTLAALPWHSGTFAPTQALFVRASQLGYLPTDPKVAVVFSAGALPDRFSVVDEGGAVAFSGTPRPSAAQTWGAFTAHADLDFSALRRPGRYIIRVP